MSADRDRLILASGSPRRRALLTEAGYDFEVSPPPDDEPAPEPNETPTDYVARLARRKAAAVRPRHALGCLLACDTVAELDGRVIGKPNDLPHARRILHSLRGRDHRVHTGLCLWPATGDPLLRVATTDLQMDAVSDDDVEEYLDSGLWVGKAGAFGYQDRVEWLHVVRGSESNVVGLPLELLAKLLAELERIDR